MVSGGQAYGGYLETMFGGAGAEVLYRPVDKALGVWPRCQLREQRDWRSAQDMTEVYRLQSVKTGHLTAY